MRRQGDHLEVKGAGHYGIFSGRRWRTVVYPQIKAFIADFHAKAALDAEVATPAPVANARARAADQAAEQIQLVIDRVEGPPEDPVAAATLPVVPPAPRARNGVARAAAKPSATNGAVAPAKKARAAAKPVSANGRAKPVAKAVVKPAAKAARKPAAKPAP